MVLPGDRTITPNPLPAAAVPSAVRPIQLPSTRVPVAAMPTMMPVPPKRLTMRPLMTELPPVTKRPVLSAGVFAPLSSMSGSPAYPGCVVPSIAVGPVIVGKLVAGAMVWTPAPAMLNLMRVRTRVSVGVIDGLPQRAWPCVTRARYEECRRTIGHDGRRRARGVVRGDRISRCWSQPRPCSGASRRGGDDDDVDRHSRGDRHLADGAGDRRSSGTAPTVDVADTNVSVSREHVGDGHVAGRAGPEVRHGDRGTSAVAPTVTGSGVSILVMARSAGTSTGGHLHAGRELRGVVAASVIVAVTNEPAARAPKRIVLPAGVASVPRARGTPITVRPSPLPDGSHAVLAKNSIMNVRQVRAERHLNQHAAACGSTGPEKSLSVSRLYRCHPGRSA